MNLDEINNRIKPVIKKVLILALYILLFWIVLPFLLVGSSLLLDRRFSFAREPTLLMICLGTALLAFAVPMLIAAITQFRKFGKRLPVSATPAPVLIQKGLFAVWRHPIYLFFTLSFIGISLVLGSMGMLLVTIPVFICLVYLYLRVEERYLIKRFGRTYENFRDKTPLVIPHFYQFLRIPGFILFKYLFSFEVRNRENIPDTSPFFVVSSHRNYLDPFYISVAIPYRISFITTYEVFRNAVTRYILRKFSAIPKKRHLHDVQTGRHIVRMLERDAVIGVFPEGERTWTGRMISFKPETLNLFKKFHHVPVLPVKLEGNFFAWPRWGNGFRKAKVTVTIQPPIRVDPGMDHGSVEAHLKSLIEPDDASDPRLFCRSGKRAGDITRVLYRCPDCFAFDSIGITGDHEFHCDSCRKRYELDPYYRVNVYENGSSHTVDLDSLYQRISIKPGDISALPDDQIPPRFQQFRDGHIIAFTDNCILYREVKRKLEIMYEGDMILTDRQLLFPAVGGPPGIIVGHISSVTIESNYKLHLFDRVIGQLYQLVFPAECAKKWQDYLVETMKKELQYTPNTR